MVSGIEPLCKNLVGSDIIIFFIRKKEIEEGRESFLIGTLRDVIARCATMVQNRAHEISECLLKKTDSVPVGSISTTHSPG